MSFERKYKLDEHCFDYLSQDSAYWIGFLYGDGSCTMENKIRLHLQYEEKEHLIAFRDFVGSIDRPIKEKLNDRCHLAMFEFRSWRIRRKLSAYGVTLRKDKRGRFPLFLIHPDLRKDFLRGLWDADGAFYYDSKRTDVMFSEIAGYKPILKDVKNILVEDNIVNVNKKIVKNGSIFRIRLAKYDTIKLIDYLYGENPKYKLKRKYALVKQYRERLNNQSAKGISDSPNQEYHRPVEGFNIGKKGEHMERTMFAENPKKCCGNCPCSSC